jgi:GH18 family chitinase
MKVATYLESWAVPFSVSSNNDISNLDSNIDTVYLSFASPDNTYTKGDFTFSNTGLNFSMDFKTVVESIRILKKRKVTVLLAVGGGSYWSNPKPFNHLGCIDLMNDLGCDGIDIDWEVGITDDRAPLNAISTMYLLMGGKRISFTCFSTGAFEASLNDKYRGMNIRTIKECKEYLDNVNVMAYDAGKDFDSIAAFKAYRAIYDGPINIGFQIGKQGWGDALLFKEELVRVSEFVKKESSSNGCFFWAYYSREFGGSISGKDAFATAKQIFTPVYPPPPRPPPIPPTKPTYSCPASVFILCPTCKTKIKTSWSV